MKRSSVLKKTLVLTLAVAMVISCAACGKKKSKSKETTAETSDSSAETTPIVSSPDTSATTTLMDYGVSIAPNDEPITWTDEEFEAKVMYVKITSGYLKIRKGPDTKYEQVGTLTAGMQVIVVAKTSNNWFKLEDGYYVSGDYISLTP